MSCFLFAINYSIAQLRCHFKQKDLKLLSKEFVGIKEEFQNIMETQTILPPPFDPEVPINSGDYEYFYFEDENGDVKRTHYLSNIEYASLDINQDSQKDLIIEFVFVNLIDSINMCIFIDLLGFL